MKHHKLFFLIALLGATLACTQASGAVSAADILKATGVKGGLVVHLGCGDGRLTAALHASDAYLVHGLDPEEANVRKARDHIRSLGLYGKVSVMHWPYARLPYADRLVNLVVAENLGKVTMGEVMRVLAPGGVAYVKERGQWRLVRKPWPRAIDQWTHYLHGPDNNAVANDTEVGPPRRTRWVAGPLWARSHEFLSSLCAMVTAGGRLFYVFDFGLTGVTPKNLPEHWTLVARDAFSGVLLWKRPVPKWGTKGWKRSALRSIPPDVPRRLVAEGDRLFFTLGYDAPVSMLDAATGKTLATYPQTQGAGELRLLDGVLLARLASGSIVAIDTAKAKTLWKSKDPARPVSWGASDGKVFYQTGKTIRCLGLRDGKTIWERPAQGTASLMVAAEGRLVVTGRGGAQALSLADGKPLWKSNLKPGGRGELFVAGGKIWVWGKDAVTGYDLATGKQAKVVDASDVFTKGHHPRCYQAKATVRYLITPNRGAEFVGIAGDPNVQNDWIRGPCRYGVMPGNGLFYAPPDPCFCYPGVKLPGFNALAPLAEKRVPALSPRLIRGTAYEALREASGQPETGDWPTYRHDPARKGSTDGQVPARVGPLWSVELPGPLTPPVVADGRVFLAAKDQFTLYALDARSGKTLWTFLAGGRIDSPPTVDGQRVVFGCGDGWVYCLRASDGALGWKFRAAPADKLIVAFGRLESPWRAHGSVLVLDGVVYCTAGRSTYLDGGIRILALDAATGKLLHETTLDTWSRTRDDAKGKPFIPGYHMEGAFSDVLVSDGQSIFMGQYKFDRRLRELPCPYVMPDPKEKATVLKPSGQPYFVPEAAKWNGLETHQRNWLERTQAGLVAELRKRFGGWSLGQRLMGLHVLSTAGFLDDTWFNRTFWTYSRFWPGYYIANLAPKTGQLLVVGPKKTYAVQSYPTRNLQSPQFYPGTKGYLLLADSNDNEPVLDPQTRMTTKGWGYRRKAPPAWFHWLPVRIRAMVLAGERLFAAGPPDVVPPDDPMASFEGRAGAELRVFAASDGQELFKMKLPSPPVFDGLVAADGRLFMTTMDGHVVCLAGR